MPSISPQSPPLEIEIIHVEHIHKERSSRSPPCADPPMKMIRAFTVDDDYFERRALRSTCIQPSPLEDFLPQASEILPGLFLCDMYTATSPAVLRHLGITHVVSIIKTVTHRYPSPVQHIAIPIEDHIQANLLAYLDHTINWIHDALRNTGTQGRVMVHCVWGMSRSASVIIGYLMARRAMSLEDALRAVKTKRRVVNPNRGFMNQLRVYEQIIRIREQDVLRLGV